MPKRLTLRDRASLEDSMADRAEAVARQVEAKGYSAEGFWRMARRCRVTAMMLRAQSA